jgi:putative hydrolase of the HAD superfamily
MTTAVLFDLDETLLDRTNALIAFLADQHARFAGRLGDAPFAVWRERFLARDARGHVHKSVVYPAILADFGGDADAAQALLADYQENCCRHARGFPGMAETLTALRGRGLKLGIVTNGETAFQTRNIYALGLDALVDTVLISQTEGLRKPDAALFRRAAERLGATPQDCLFVGDNPVADILGAHAAGMQTLWFRNDQAWPHDIDAMPGASIERLAQVLDWTSV